MENVFVTADCHFDHYNMITKNYCDRPYTTVDEHNEFLVERWNSVVKPKDKVIIVGDFAWKKPEYWLSRVNGRKILIRGNHDQLIKEHTKSLEFIKDLWMTKVNAQPVVFCHYQLHTWNRDGYGAWHLYGHSHGMAEEVPTKLSFDVGIDVWDYTPVHWDVITMKMNDKIPQWEEFMQKLKKERDSVHKIDKRKINYEVNLKYIKAGFV